jgi:hypothetical protein
MYHTRLAQFLYEKVRSLIRGKDSSLVDQVIKSAAEIPPEGIAMFLGEVDEHLVPRLAGESLLRLGQALASMNPEWIPAHMPILFIQTTHLARAKEVADLFQRDALDRLIEGLRNERASLALPVGQASGREGD